MKLIIATSESLQVARKKLLPSNTSHMKTHVHQYDMHAGEIPRKEDVSVANIKHK